MEGFCISRTATQCRQNILYALYKFHRINQLPNPLNLHHNLIAILQIPRRLHPNAHAPRRPSHDTTPRLQRLPLTKERNKLLNSKAKIRSARILPLLSINKSLQPQIIPITQQLRAHNTRPHRSVIIERFRESPLGHHTSFILVHLPVAAGDVVAAHVAGYVVEGFILGDVLTVFAD